MDTSGSPQTLGFYEKYGFGRSRLVNTENFDQPIFEGGSSIS